MTEKQKQAIILLNKLKENMTEEDYFLLLDFVVGDANPTLIPYYPTYPHINLDTKPIPVTCATSDGQNEQKINELSEEDIKNLNRISIILYESGQVQNWWREERLISKEESDYLCNWLKLFYNKVKLWHKKIKNYC